ncbi:MAG TPA: rod shape-determining protein MreC [Candidatus Limnocylindria bacterium]|nr:rod shape-determining protein MreC [Candidatus Limnocylindria bacterium]
MRDNRRTRFVLGALLLASFTLITLDLRGAGGPVSGIRSAAGAVFGPIERAVSSVVTPVGAFFGGLGQDDQARLDQLERENAELRLQQRTDDYTRQRAQQLDDLLRVAGIGRYRVLPAQVIAVGSAQGFAWTIQIDAGSRDGLKVNQTVLNGDGLVGRIEAVTSSTATVLLLVDPESSVGVRIEGNLELGILTGQGLAALELKLLDPQAPLAVGDRLVTRGDGSLYVPGIPVGVVRSVRSTPGSLIRTAQVDPYVNVSALDLVGVVIDGPRTDPRDSVLPPRPTPTTSPSGTPSGSPSPSPTGSQG